MAMRICGYAGSAEEVRIPARLEEDDLRIGWQYIYTHNADSFEHAKIGCVRDEPARRNSGRLTQQQRARAGQGTDDVCKRSGTYQAIEGTHTEGH
jgi:hypothetical protein